MPAMRTWSVRGFADDCEVEVAEVSLWVWCVARAIDVLAVVDSLLGDGICYIFHRSFGRALAFEELRARPLVRFPAPAEVVAVFWPEDEEDD